MLAAVEYEQEDGMVGEYFETKRETTDAEVFRDQVNGGLLDAARV